MYLINAYFLYCMYALYSCGTSSALTALMHMKIGIKNDILYFFSNPMQLKVACA